MYRCGLDGNTESERGGSAVAKISRRCAYSAREMPGVTSDAVIRFPCVKDVGWESGRPKRTSGETEGDVENCRTDRTAHPDRRDRSRGSTLIAIWRVKLRGL